MAPVLHLEAHGGADGLTSSTEPNAEWLTWEELSEPLQRLNLATRCNLILAVAACVGYATVQSFQRGPRAPAVALVGPDANVTPSEILAGTKEFYRRWMDTGTPQEIAQSASSQMGEVRLELEPSTTLCYEALVEFLVKSARPLQLRKRTQGLRQRLLAETALTQEVIENGLALPTWPACQQIWDEMFMIDLWPENRERFGLDVKGIMERIERFVAKQN